MTDHAHQEAEGREQAHGAFWLQLEGDQNAGPPWERHLSLSTSGNVPNGTILTTFLFAYIGYHTRLLAHHQCSHVDCQLVEAHQQVLALLETVLDQTAHLMTGCNEAPEAEGEDHEAE